MGDVRAPDVQLVPTLILFKGGHAIARWPAPWIAPDLSHGRDSPSPQSNSGQYPIFSVNETFVSFDKTAVKLRRGQEAAILLLK